MALAADKNESNQQYEGLARERVRQTTEKVEEEQGKKMYVCI